MKLNANLISENLRNELTLFKLVQPAINYTNNKMEYPKISIGMPIYNERETLEQTLLSVIMASKKTRLLCEILLCFNGTTDDGIQIVKKMEKRNVNIKILKSNAGRTRAMRKIIDTAKGDIIIFCDGDIIVEEDCYSNLLGHFKSKEIIAVVGNPCPLKKKGILYNILNIRMMNFGSEISRMQNKKFRHKPFIHGRIFAIKRSFFINNNLFIDRFENAINDDMFITHLIMYEYGRKSIVHEKNAKVKYLPVQSLAQWWKKWVRLWGDLDHIYKQNPEFKKLKSQLKTKIDWTYVSKRPMSTQFYFIIERIFHHLGRFYFNTTKIFYYRERCLRLDDTKRNFVQ
jgi:glycosyltransferase involved in cell wall biosynthesis